MYICEQAWLSSILCILNWNHKTLVEKTITYSTFVKGLMGAYLWLKVGVNLAENRIRCGVGESTIQFHIWGGGADAHSTHTRTHTHTRLLWFKEIAFSYVEHFFWREDLPFWQNRSTNQSRAERIGSSTIYAFPKTQVCPHQFGILSQHFNGWAKCLQYRVPHLHCAQKKKSQIDFLRGGGVFYFFGKLQIIWRKIQFPREEDALTYLRWLTPKLAKTVGPFMKKKNPELLRRKNGLVHSALWTEQWLHWCTQGDQAY